MEKCILRPMSDSISQSSLLTKLIVAFCVQRSITFGHGVSWLLAAIVGFYYRVPHALLHHIVHFSRLVNRPHACFMRSLANYIRYNREL